MRFIPAAAMVRILSIGSVALALVTLPAHATVNAKMPAEMLGAWCYKSNTTDDTERYVRGQCEPGNRRIVIAADGSISNDERQCKTVSSTVAVGRREVFTVESHCRLQWHAYKLKMRMWLKEIDVLIIQSKL
jgi:hypothetical protein